jgi:Ca2+-binding EF-hand superfamily protein
LQTFKKYELQEFFEKLGKDYYKDGVAYADFERKVMLDLKRTDGVEELRNAFIAIDFSCKGFLTIDDLQKQFELIAPHIVQHTIVADIFRYEILNSEKGIFPSFISNFWFYRELDRDGDGRVSYKDFEIAMQYIDDTEF